MLCFQKTISRLALSRFKQILRMFFSAKQRVQSNCCSEIEDATYVIIYDFSHFKAGTSTGLDIGTGPMA